jgi:hypothetical protein
LKILKGPKKRAKTKMARIQMGLSRTTVSPPAPGGSATRYTVTEGLRRARGEHASRSRLSDPDRPPATAGSLRSQVPDLVHGPRELLDCRQLQQAGRREPTGSLLRQEVEGGHRLGSFSYHTGPSEPRTTLPSRRRPASIRLGIVFCAEDLTGCGLTLVTDITRQRTTHYTNPLWKEGYRNMRYAVVR